MTDPVTPRRRGRPVSAASRQAVLDAAAELLAERGWGGFSVDEVARRSGVSKATIYSHWPGGFAIAVTAFGDRVTAAVPVRPTGDAVRDLRRQALRLARFYAGRQGAVAAQLVAAGTSQPGGADLVRERFFAARRTATRTLIESGQAAGQLRADVDPELAIDLLFGPIVFRLFNGEGPLTARQAGAVADLALAALAAG